MHGEAGRPPSVDRGTIEGKGREVGKSLYRVSSYNNMCSQKILLPIFVSLYFVPSSQLLPGIQLPFGDYACTIC